MSKNRVSIIACGGTGINIVNKYIELVKNTGSKKLPETIYALDTSRDANPPSEEYTEVFRYTGLDGSAGERAKNYEIIKRETPTHIDKMDLAKFTVIISSTGGGTGSVTQACAIQSVIDNGSFPIVFMVGDLTSPRYAANTAKSLKGLVTLSVKNEVSVPFFYEQNQKPQDDNIDAIMSSHIESIVDVLMVGLPGIDTEDLKSILNAPRAIGIDPYPTRLGVAMSQQGEDLDVCDIEVITALVVFNTGDDVRKVPVSTQHYKSTIFNTESGDTLTVYGYLDSELLEGNIKNQQSVERDSKARAAKIAESNNAIKNMVDDDIEL